MLIQRLFTSPGRTIIFSMMITIGIGTVLLALPIAQQEPLTWLDCMFTATSSVCVTGLLTVPLSSFTPWGHAIMLCLIQIGALGVITLSIFFWSLFSTVGLSTRVLTEEAFELNVGQKPIQLAIFSFIFTMCAECIGFLTCFLLIRPYYEPSKACFYALFHAVSSFCSAGISLIPYQNPVLSMPVYQALLIITGLLVMVSSLGFVVWRELTSYCLAMPRLRRPHISLHSKIVLMTTAIIIGVMTVLIFLLQYRTVFFEQPTMTYIIESVFNAITLRSAGFTTLPLGIIAPATMFLLMIVSFIGSAPGSTGSGVKVTTFAVFLATIKATLLRRDAVEIRNRTIPNDQVFKAMAIFSISLAFLAIIIFLLLITEYPMAPFDIICEGVYSFTNLGTSRGLTRHLSGIGKYIVMISMFIGRIGSLTVLLALKRQRRHQEFYYPEERILIG